MAKDRPANFIADIGKPVFGVEEDREADGMIAESTGEIVSEIFPLKNKKGVCALKRSKRKEADGIVDKITAQRNKATLPHSNYEGIELDMAGYGASYSLPKNK